MDKKIERKIQKKIMENESFRGNYKNPEKVEAFETLCAIARFLEAREDPLLALTHTATDLEERKKNALICLDIETPVFQTDHDSVKALSDMFLLADDYSISVADDGCTVRISFGVQDVWSE